MTTTSRGTSGEPRAGRELDQRVATEVMGGCAHPFESWTREGPEGDRETVCGVCRSSRTSHPRYSTDIAAAWEVVEKLCERGFYPEVTRIMAGNGGDDWWRCEIRTRDHSLEDCWLDADSAPLAIVKAALAAIEASAAPPRNAQLAEPASEPAADAHLEDPDDLWRSP